MIVSAVLAIHAGPFQVVLAYRVRLVLPVVGERAKVTLEAAIAHIVSRFTDQGQISGEENTLKSGLSPA